MQSGLPLINVNIFLQVGDSKFDRAIPVAGVTKDSRGIFELRSKLVDERGGEDSVVGRYVSCRRHRSHGAA